jgi:hypothetical protein
MIPRTNFTIRVSAIWSHLVTANFANEPHELHTKFPLSLKRQLASSHNTFWGVFGRAGTAGVGVGSPGSLGLDEILGQIFFPAIAQRATVRIMEHILFDKAVFKLY